MNFHLFKLLPLIVVVALLSGCSVTAPKPDDWIETQMYFGLTENVVRIPDADWHDFVNKQITPRFPDGLTIQYGDGQYRGSDGKTHTEPSAIVTILHPPIDDRKLTEIAALYDQRFHQESVLRSDWHVSADFIVAPKSLP